MSSARAQSDSNPTADGFGQFSFHTSLEKGLAQAGFETPRPIQQETIPACLEGRDVMGLAQTGTGKTAAFSLPILQTLIEDPGRGPLVLILAPTRELALQIRAEIELLAKFVDVESVALIGGVPLGGQLRALRRDPEIVVGCPGRVLDLIQQRKLDVSAVDTLVLDEADHMFDLGFLPDLRKILAALPKDRQNLLFSATMPKEIRGLANDLLDDPHVVELAASAPAEAIEHGLYETDSSRKRGLLDWLLSEEDCKTAIVFTRTKHRAKRLAQQLERGGRSAVALQGNMSQGQRDRAMGGFRAGRFDVLVATDIAARGIDVAGVDYVINYDRPEHRGDVHASDRTHGTLRRLGPCDHVRHERGSRLGARYGEDARRAPASVRDTRGRGRRGVDRSRVARPQAQERPWSRRSEALGIGRRRFQEDGGQAKELVFATTPILPGIGPTAADALVRAEATYASPPCRTDEGESDAHEARGSRFGDEGAFDLELDLPEAVLGGCVRLEQERVGPPARACQAEASGRRVASAPRKRRPRRSRSA